MAAVVGAIAIGARDYLDKPMSPDRLREHFEAARLLAARRPLVAAAPPVGVEGDFCGLVGRSEPMRELFGLIVRAASRSRSALVTGETGTGKELVARALHAMGPRADRRYVAVDCCAADRLSFAGVASGEADGDPPAGGDVFAAAQGGTLFLDGVDALPLAAQARVLRVMETGELFAAGTREPRRVDVHVIASTSQDLRRAIAQGRFRVGLYLQLAVVELRLPRLDERRDDIPRLADVFVRRAAARLGKAIFGLDPDAADRLAAADWPGHVRELKNTIERACLFAGGEHVTARDVALALPGRSPWAAPAARRAARWSPEELARVLARVRGALVCARGNKAAAARLLGISRRALYRRLAQLGRAVDRPAAPAAADEVGRS